MTSSDDATPPGAAGAGALTGVSQRFSTCGHYAHTIKKSSMNDRPYSSVQTYFSASDFARQIFPSKKPVRDSKRAPPPIKYRRVVYPQLAFIWPKTAIEISPILTFEWRV